MKNSSTEIEQSLLGALLRDNTQRDELDLRPADFTDGVNRAIYGLITEMVDKDLAADAVTLTEYAERRKVDVGGLAYLGGLVKNAVPANAQSYARILRDRTLQRDLVRKATEIAQLAQDPDLTANEALDKAQSLLLAMNQSGSDEAQAAKDILIACVDGIDRRFQSGNTLVGIPTGFVDIDNMVSGLEPGTLVIVAGRPSMGKTALAMNVADHVASDEGVATAVFSLEMPAEAVMNRAIAARGRIDFSRIRNGRLDEQDWPRLTNAVGRINNAPLFIDDTPGLSVNDLRARARRLAKRENLGLIVVDYLQLMKGDGTNRTEEVGDISSGLKNLARELNVPVVALSQLNRSLEQRPNKRPVMSDLRQSGAIEQDADVIIFIYRDEVYHEDSPDKGTAEIDIAKQRNGPIGTVRLTFLGQYCRFENHVYRPYQDAA